METHFLCNVLNLGKLTYFNQNNMMLIFFLAQNIKTKHKPTCEMDDRGTLHRASLEAGGRGEPMQLTGT